MKNIVSSNIRVEEEAWYKLRLVHKMVLNQEKY